MRSFLLGDDTRCDLDALVDTRLLVQANSGGGKSWCLRRILEQTHGKVQHLVIDPEGEFSSLRERFDYVLAARSGGDTAADPRSAQLLAEKLLDLKVSAILDIYELKAHDRVRFVRAFLEALVDAPKALWHPALVVVDEAHVFAPQVGEAESLGAVIDLATRGRKRGFCAVLATQRLSKLHKDAAAECNNVLIGRTGLDVDIKRAADTLGLVGREESHALRELSPGTFHAFGPAFGLGVHRVVVGPVETKHPKAGSRIAFTAPPPTDKIRSLLPQLADLPAEADARAKSMDDLKRELAETRRKLTLAEKAQPVAPAPERVEVSVVTDMDRGAIEAFSGRLEEVAGEIRRTLEKAARAGEKSLAALRVPEHVKAAHVVQKRVGEMKRRDAEAAADGARTAPEQRILDALAWWESIGVDAPDKGQAGFIARYRVGKNVGGTFGNLLGRLRSRGLLDYPSSGTVSLTDEGRAVARAPDETPTTEALQRAVHARLDGPESRVLQVLIDAYPGALTKQECGARSDYSVRDSVGGTFGNILGRLRSLGLIDYPHAKAVVALPVLFLENR